MQAIHRLVARILIQHGLVRLLTLFSDEGIDTETAFFRIGKLLCILLHTLIGSEDHRGVRSAYIDLLRLLLFGT